MNTSLSYVYIYLREGREGFRGFLGKHFFFLIVPIVPFFFYINNWPEKHPLPSLTPLRQKVSGAGKNVGLFFVAFSIMDRHSTNAAFSLTFLLRLFPDDDVTRADLKRDFRAALAHCEKLKEEAVVEEDAAMKGSLQKAVLDTSSIMPVPVVESKEEEPPAVDLSEWKQQQLIVEAIAARDQLRATLEEVEIHLKALQPTDKEVETVA